MLGIRSEHNRPSRLETWLRAQKARWAVRQPLSECSPALEYCLVTRAGAPAFLD